VPEVTVTVRCRLENLAFTAAAARGVAAEQMGSAAASLVEIAVTEFCSNIVRHGHPEDPDHEFTMRLRGIERGLEIEIRDAGPIYSVEPSEMPSFDVDLDDLPEGGFGMALVRETMDAVEHFRDGDVNVVRLVKRDAAAREEH
jgi:serine/threonine-protein kinase RsbW